jgi:hypothetical protein
MDGFLPMIFGGAGAQDALAQYRQMPLLMQLLAGGALPAGFDRLGGLGLGGQIGQGVLGGGLSPLLMQIFGGQ